MALIKKMLFVWIALIVVCLDQYSKYYMVLHIMPGDVQPIFPHVNVILAHNQGAAFGFLHNAGGIQQFLFIGIAIIMTLFFVWEAWKHRDNAFYAVVFGLILGGAWGNVIDRLYLHYVIDFIDVFYQSWHFATFNFADSAITVGAIFYVLLHVMGDKKNIKNHTGPVTHENITR